MASIYTSLPYFRKPVAAVPLAPVLSKEDPEDIKVEPLKRKDVDKAADTALKAFADDPVAKYIYQTPDAKPPPKHGGHKGAKRVWWLIVVGQIKTKLALTVNGGESIIFANPARPDRKRKGPAGHIFILILALLAKLGRALSSPEQKRRAREVEWKIKHLIFCNLGHRVNDLVHIDLLATTPEKQDKGYGSALVKEVIKYADEHGRGIFLETDTESDVEFYESFGFEVVGETFLGEHNPTWHEDPVVVSLLVREHKKYGDEKAPLLV